MNDKYNGEQVVCLRTEDVCGLKKFGPYYVDFDKYVPVFAPRHRAEYDRALKQLIPYVIISDGNGYFLSYRRNSGDNRLIGNKSIGWGGHVNPCDRTNTLTPLSRMIANAAFREIKEETGYDPEEKVLDYLGYINDDSDNVGKYHIGIVFMLTVNDPSVSENVEHTDDFRWIHFSNYDNKYEEFEGWSKIARDFC